MSIKLANKGIGQIFFVNSSGVKKEIIAASYGSTFVYTKKFDKTFYTNSTFTVPAGVKQIYVDCVGAQGYNSPTGGLGGRVICLLTTTPGQTLYIVVGTMPTTRSTPIYNASDIRTNSSDLYSRLIVAGGGGSNGVNTGQEGGDVYVGGAGGGTTGGNGSTGAGAIGYGGTQSSGGSSSTAAVDFGLGGAGNSEGNAGAGGAGWFGGGGGTLIYYSGKHGGYYRGASGGGGSSYTHPTLCSQVPGIGIHSQGVRSGNGYIKIANYNFF